MSPKLAALALADLALAVVLLVMTDSTIGTVSALVLVAAGVAVAGLAVLRRPTTSPEQGLQRADADAAREETTAKATRDRVEDGGYNQSGGQ